MSDEKQTWWSSIPNTLKAVAAIITALTGLVLAWDKLTNNPEETVIRWKCEENICMQFQTSNLNKGYLSKLDCDTKSNCKTITIYNRWKCEENNCFEFQTSDLNVGYLSRKDCRNLTDCGKANKIAFSNSYIIRGTYSIDLDLGVQGSRSTSDLFWQLKNASQRSLTPTNGAKICIIGQTSKYDYSLTELKNLNYRSTEIIANSNLNRIPTQTVVAYITSQNKYGVLKVIQYGKDLGIKFYTYE